MVPTFWRPHFRRLMRLVAGVEGIPCPNAPLRMIRIALGEAMKFSPGRHEPRKGGDHGNLANSLVDLWLIAIVANYPAIRARTSFQ